MDYKTIIFLLFIGWLIGAATCVVIVIIVDRLKKKPEPAKNDWAESLRTSSYNVCLTMLRLEKAMVESKNIKLEKENKKLKDQVELLKSTLDVYGDQWAKAATDSTMKNHHFCDTKKQFVENGCCCGQDNKDTSEKIEWIWKFDRIGMSMKDGSVVSISKPESGFLLKNECSPEVWEKLTELTKIKEDGSAEGE